MAGERGDEPGLNKPFEEPLESDAGGDPQAVGSPPVTDREIGLLLQEARAARRRAYAPYSGFTVGAAVLGFSGRIHVGCNVENASYGLSLCAERAAVAAAVVNGDRRIRAVAVVGGGAGAVEISLTPCGACRQVIHEHGGGKVMVITTGPQGTFVLASGGELFPRAFGAAQLARPGAERGSGADGTDGTDGTGGANQATE
ncbi:MAG: cytidine deaminase [Firmicutes bacterium]|nr:cytidine deaminase [Bacillota bacterium]